MHICLCLPRPLNFSTHWLCLSTFDSRDFEALNESGAVGETPRGAPCLLATSIPCGRAPLRTLHATLAGGQKPRRGEVPSGQGLTASALHEGSIHSCRVPLHPSLLPLQFQAIPGFSPRHNFFPLLLAQLVKYPEPALHILLGFSPLFYLH